MMTLALGDVVGKGPHTPEAISLLQSIGAESIIGNHEIKLRSSLRSRPPGVSTVPPAAETLTVGSLVPAHDAAKPKAQSLASTLADSQIEWLSSFELFRDIAWPAVAPAADASAAAAAATASGHDASCDPATGVNITAVHAGVPPKYGSAAEAAVAADAGEDALAWMRAAPGRDAEPGSKACHAPELKKRLLRAGWECWARVWGGGGRAPLVFGHAAGGRLQLCPRACGLDTGCSRGAMLSGLVLEPCEAGLLAAAAARLSAERDAAAAGEAATADLEGEDGLAGLPCTLYAVESVETWSDPGSSSAHRSVARGCPELHDRSTLDELAAALPRVLTGGATADPTDDRSHAWRLVKMDCGQVPFERSIASVEAGDATVWAEAWPCEGEVALESTKENHVRVLRARMEWKLWMNPTGIR